MPDALPFSSTAPCSPFTLLPLALLASPLLPTPKNRTFLLRFPHSLRPHLPTKDHYPVSAEVLAFQGESVAASAYFSLMA